VTSCYQFAARAIQRHVTVTAVPAACQGLSQLEVNATVSRALHAAVTGARGKVRQREAIARDGPYVAGLIRAVPASGRPTVRVSPSRPPSREALSLAALVSWLVTAGLGVSMMARWIIRNRRRGTGPPRGPGPVLNLAHFGLALTGLLMWISYLATGVTGLAWGACGLLLAVASLGMTLVWLGPASTVTAPRPGDGPPPAGHPPVFVIAAHVTAACITILLTTLAAIGIG
jgi:manganese efflux pump family protein